MEATTPLLKIVGLHVEGLRALRNVDWPADGMGWSGAVPDTVVIGGVNGSGKTTLLELLFGTVRALGRAGTFVWESSRAVNAWVDLLVRGAGLDEVFRLVVGDADFIAHHRRKTSLCFVRRGDEWGHGGDGEASTSLKVHKLLASNGERFAATDLPSAIYLPSDRALVIPDEPYKAAGNLRAPPTFTHRFQVPTKWTESLEAVLYAARWADLNALAAGRTEHNFDVYAEAFSTFFEGKRLEWEDGELCVRLADGGRHGLDALSSGEKQVVIIVSELLRRWRPGSLLLIDEPESHMHPVWLAKLWDLLKRWQRERGGQLIVATQSTQLFGLADASSRVLLGGRDFR